MRAPSGAEPVLTASGEIAGYIRPRSLNPGGAFRGGVDVYKGTAARPYCCVQTRAEGAALLLALRERLAPEFGSGEWPPRSCGPDDGVYE
jgi:hypothetical protein